MNVLLKHQPAPTARTPVRDDLIKWIGHGFVMTKPNGSARHRLETALLSGSVVDLINDCDPYGHNAKGDTQSFVIEHDWASAFRGAEEFDEGAYRLPFPQAYFEFRVSGRSVIILAEEIDDYGLMLMPFVETDAGWVLPHSSYALSEGEWQPTFVDDDGYTPLVRMLAAQVRAVCILLEAGVADTEVVLAPEKLNKARAKRGKPPVADYLVVKLHRTRHGSHGTSDAPHTPRRLHFRRGHWRQLEAERRTWVRWCLVGDPDLGFINKHYRL